MSQQNQTSQYFKCSHEKKVTKSGISNCYTCGLYLPEDGQNVYKTHKLKFGVSFNPQLCLKSAKKVRQPLVAIDPQSEYGKARSQLIEYMWDIAEKLRLTLNSTHISIYFMDLLNSKKSIPSTQFNLYSATAVMLGAKAIELDERIPFISKLKRYSGLYNNTTKEFARAENDFVKALKWNLQCVTLIDVVEFYLSQGIIMENDQILKEDEQISIGNLSNNETSTNESSSNNLNPLQEKSLNSLDDNKLQQQQKDLTSQKELKSPITDVQNEQIPAKQIFESVKQLKESEIYSMASKVEKDYTRLTNLIIRNSEFYKFDINTLACACVALLRSVSGIHNKWNVALQKISGGVEEQQIQQCYDLISSQFKNYFSMGIKKASSHHSKGASLKHSKTTDINDVENQYLKYSHQKPAQHRNSFLKDPASFDTNALKNSSKNNYNSDLISFQNNQMLKKQNSNNFQSGISTLNNGSNINNIQGNYVRHQSTLLSNYPTQNNNNNHQTAAQFNQRFSTSSYVQKVYRVNSGNI